ncbi:uncharacterized protein LOC100680384 [Nasonia vitripennis]|uniref:Uncharacterized protein n=1 Tax=Nasonia vitripennis TaxID=7425 RepID=A0A7M7Q3F3_NASVI|nr:uncharacterized protein LOC100680384 [Nasonia vitripennis]XP_031781251.1 uncharacterized protein LOC100680384 [Nasonia vitripennis]XP_031781252.1 uncharacterized protein LOC100680384 [Nasonia vitripennis]XP_032457554.1 uncharacterized protein LOC100680384 [Nasonia vitripennis]
MEKDIVVSPNASFIHDVMTSLARNFSSYLANIDQEAYRTAICVAFTIIGTSSYMFYKIKGENRKRIENSFRSKKGRESLKLSHRSSTSDFDYSKVLNEFHNACNNGSNVYSSMKCIQMASNYPELINVKMFSDGVTPFHRVCFHGNEALVDFMLAKGADPELKTVAGENALCMALYYYLYTEKKDLNCLDTLYEKGCCFKSEDEWYRTFLNLSIKSNNQNLTRWLLTHSKAKNNKSFTRASSAPL